MDVMFVNLEQRGYNVKRIQRNQWKKERTQCKNSTKNQIHSHSRNLYSQFIKSKSTIHKSCAKSEISIAISRS